MTIEPLGKFTTEDSTYKLIHHKVMVVHQVNEPLELKRFEHIPNAAINGNDVVVQKAASLNPL